MNRQACAQPGCTGTVVDGYCDVCGMPPANPSTAPSAPATTSAEPSGSTGQSAPGVMAGTGDRCSQPGCSGTIQDGYCDVCGSPAPPSPAPPSPASPSPASTTGHGSPVDDDATVAAGVDSPGTTGSSSVRLGSAALGSQRVGSSSTRRVRTSRSRSRSARLGAGLTSVPPAPAVDPAAAINPNPEVAESKRSCANCGGPVGRSSQGRPGRPEGFCPACGKPFSFTPKLRPGDLVAGQYEVAGALAHGGMGWIYLARDRNVSDRWVVLKGLLNSGDADALAAAISEQRFLAQVEHPLIVEIYNFVTHEDAGYIVMEYVGGTSLKQVLKSRMVANNGVYDPLPVDQALAFIIEILPAFQYLHDLGLVYCDFKPDNLIQVGDALKLIDLGGVRHVDDQVSAIYGTVGYQAPEVAELGPSIASDIWTIGRTLLVLCMEFRGYQTTYLSSLPDPATTPFFQHHDSLYWLLARCCAADPDDRFTSADELRTQALGILREVVAARVEGATLTSAASTLFSTPTVSTSRIDWSQLPTLRPDQSDPQHTWLAALAPGEPAERLAALERAPADSPEVWLARGAEHLALGDADAAARDAAAMLQEDPWEWRALWLAGVAALQKQDFATARTNFNAVYRQVPGELAPKLALAVACEASGAPDVAETLYLTCARTDAAYLPPAAFGIARLRAARGDRVGAVEALDLVPTTSRGYGESRRMRGEVLLSGAGHDVGMMDQALASVGGIRMDPWERDVFSARVYERALEAAHQARSGATIGGVPAVPRQIRHRLEEIYRSMARQADGRDERIALVTKANQIREWSLT